MMTIKDIWTLRAMTKYGGGFVKKLAEAAHQADAVNFEKIRATWPDYFEKYEFVGANLRAQKNKKDGS